MHWIVLHWVKLKHETLNINVNGLLGVVSTFSNKLSSFILHLSRSSKVCVDESENDYLCINSLLLTLQLICNLQRKFRFQLYTISQNFTCTCVNATLTFALNGHEPKAKQYHQNCNSSESITDMTGSNRRFHTLIFSIWIQYVFSI